MGRQGPAGENLVIKLVLPQRFEAADILLGEEDVVVVERIQIIAQQPLGHGVIEAQLGVVDVLKEPGHRDGYLAGIRFTGGQEGVGRRQQG